MTAGVIRMGNAVPPPMSFRRIFTVGCFVQDQIFQKIACEIFHDETFCPSFGHAIVL